MVLNSFNDPDGRAILSRRIAQPPSQSVSKPQHGRVPAITFENLDPCQEELALAMIRQFTEAANINVCRFKVHVKEDE